MKAKKYKTSSLKFEMLSSTEVNIRFISKSGNLEEIEVEKEAILLLSEFFEYKSPKSVFKKCSFFKEGWKSFEKLILEFESLGILVSDSRDQIIHEGKSSKNYEDDFVKSKYLSTFQLAPGRYLVSHPFYLNSCHLEEKQYNFLKSIGENYSDLEFQQKVQLNLSEINSLLTFFRSKRLIFPRSVDEDGEIKYINSVKEDILEPFKRPSSFENEALITNVFLNKRMELNILVIGGCLVQFVLNELPQIGEKYNIKINAFGGFPDSTEYMISKFNPQVTVLQMSTANNISSLWDEMPFLDSEERKSRLETLRIKVNNEIESVRKFNRGRLLIVHGFVLPAINPNGMFDYMNEYSFSRIVFEINQFIIDLIKDDSNVVYFDEEILSSTWGKIRLYDEGIVRTGHHGPLDMICGSKPYGLSRNELFESSRDWDIAKKFGQRYIDTYLAWSGENKIKVIIVDLDNTLWPGVLGEEGFSWDTENMLQALGFGAYGGLHQTLKYLKSRGVLLAVSSKNDETDVFKRWAELEEFSDSNGFSWILRRDDFVMHKINWEPKSKNIAEVIRRLEFSPAQALFIDDNPVEREEVKFALNDINIIGENYNALKYQLLANPLLESISTTKESANRTELTKQQLQREFAREFAPNEHEFMKSLSIKLYITKVTDFESCSRIHELIQKSNQYNVRMSRYTLDEIRSYVERADVDVMTLHVEDKFAKYGLVAVLIIKDNMVDTFVMSCRVIGLKPAKPFLLASLSACMKKEYVNAEIVEGPRNHPCRSIFSECGFSEIESNKFRVDKRELLNAEENIYEIFFDMEQAKGKKIAG